MVGACAPIMDALNAANQGDAASYGADDITLRLQTLAREIFETQVAVFPVATGTAANALALSQLAPPYAGIYCYEAAHIVIDECGAPELFTGGAKLLGLPGEHGRVSVASLERAYRFATETGASHVPPAALSLTQATEWGTVYEPAHIEALCEYAHAHDLGTHMDGARFANALAALGCTPAQATWKAGIDVLSLGATKNGALCAEAVVFFDPRRAEHFDRRRKRCGHVWSKMRYLSAQLEAYLTDGLWLANAKHANELARRLADELSVLPGVTLNAPAQVNEVFVELPAVVEQSLKDQGFGFYRWALSERTHGVPVRFVTSYAHTLADVDALVGAARSACRL